MAFLSVLPTILSVLVFCAHLVREGGLILVFPLLIVMPFLFVPSGWVARFFQVMLIVMAFEWVRTLVMLAIERHEAGRPWLRMACILGAVVLFNLLAAGLFENRHLKAAYPRRARW